MDPEIRKHMRRRAYLEAAETGSSISKMDPKKKKKQKLSKSQVLASPSLSKEELQEAMKKINDAALVLASKVIASEARNSNFVFSPTSINAALSMMATINGKASEELNAVYSDIATVVFGHRSANGGPRISSVNGVWVEQSLPFNHSSKTLLENVFKATFSQVDFRFKAEEVRRELNKWASKHTNGIIRDLLPPGSVTSQSVYVCGNALYFKGAWEMKFEKSLTKDRMFHLLIGEPVRVPFMSSHKFQYVKAYDGFKVLGLPYRKDGNDDTNRRFSMYFYLPDKKDGLNNLLEEMTSTPGFLDSHIPIYRVQVGDFRIPKFNISFMFEASRFFEGEVSMSMYHKALVEIDEEGAEAAAVTFGGMKVGACRSKPRPPPKIIDFVADHPFLFLIREDKTGTVLFAGQIFDPRKM